MASESGLLVKILTPLGAVLHQEASMVIVPGIEGEVGILPQHVSTIFKLDAGLVKVYSGDRIANTTFVFGGFAKIHQDQLYILVDKTCSIDDLNHDEAQNSLLTLEQELLKTRDPDIILLIDEKIRVVRKIVELSKPRH
jgi:F-type H+-transporting ATPase subunit epsilon